MICMQVCKIYFFYFFYIYIFFYISDNLSGIITHADIINAANKDAR